MMKHFIFLLLIVLASSAPRIIQLLRLLSPECNNHGYLSQNKCFCQSQWKGQKCEEKANAQIYDDKTTDCDDLINRLDDLDNISPEYYPGDDNFFSRFNENSIGDGDAAYGEKGSTWIRMHDATKNFTIFGSSLDATDIKQGALGDCYLLAAFVSLCQVNGGQSIKDAFLTKEDNANHVYVTRWMINGKPRFVSTDEWIPGKDGVPSFSKASNDNEFWAIILEKAWAKIHGSFMGIEAGWHTEVWKALTQAPIYDKYHSSKDNSSSIYKKIKELIEKGYPVGCATVNVEKSHEVSGHAYAVVGAYQVTLDNGKTENLIRVYNPWNREVWDGNPWGDNSSAWTENVKKQVPYENKNDGLFFVSADDYLGNFGVTNWGELEKGYDISFIEFSFKDKESNDYEFSFKFTYSGPENQPFYIYVDQISDRVHRGCTDPLQVNNIEIIDSNGKSYGFDKWSKNIKVSNATKGVYQGKIKVGRDKNYLKSFALTAYSYNSSVNFEDNGMSSNVEGLKCPKNCNNQGFCNVFDGVCTCFGGYGGDDCSKKIDPSVVINPCENAICANQGECNKKTGKCLCPSGYIGDRCEEKDKCGKITCSYRGNCDPYTGKCQCFGSYSGDNCQTRDLCSGKVCGANKVCQPRDGKCVCKEGFFGENCDLNEDPCKGKICSRRGYCENGQCICNEGFFGVNCEIKDPCLTESCSRKGRCVYENNQVKCICRSGYIGEKCEKKINKNDVPQPPPPPPPNYNDDLTPPPPPPINNDDLTPPPPPPPHFFDNQTPPPPPPPHYNENERNKKNSKNFVPPPPIPPPIIPDKRKNKTTLILPRGNGSTRRLYGCYNNNSICVYIKPACTMESKKEYMKNMCPLTCGYCK